jgi:DNA polymerase IV
MKESSILHIDGDDFFASITRLKEPNLRKRPLIIGHLNSRGAVVSTSREIRQSGITPGLSMMQAKRICPDAELVQIDWSLVQRVSREFFSLISRYSPVIEQSGVDAVFLDYSGCDRLFGPAEDFAFRLQKEIRDQIGFSVSLGIAADKAVSVVACRAAKMGMLESVHSGSEKIFLQECPLDWLPGINSRLLSFFSYLGIKTIGNLGAIPTNILEHVLGTDGRVLSLRARGLEKSPVRRSSPEESPEVQLEFTKDMLSPDSIVRRLAVLASELCGKLRRKHLSARCLVTQLIYSDRRIERIQKPLDPPSNRDHEVFQLAHQSFLKLYHRRVRIRDVALRAGHLIHSPTELPLGTAERRLKWDRVFHTVDQVRQKHSPTAVLLGASLPSYPLPSSLTNKNTPHLSQFTRLEFP